MTKTKIKEVAEAVRVVRQYRDDDRGKCPAGAAYYEEHIAPDYIARVAITAMREPTKEMIEATYTWNPGEDPDTHYSAEVYWRKMNDEALK